MPNRRQAPDQPPHRDANPATTLPLIAIVIDAEGTVMAIDREEGDHTLSGNAWAEIMPGTNYIAACESLNGPDAGMGNELATGIRGILAGSTNSFEITYIRSLGDGSHRFIGRAMRIPGRGTTRVVVTHTDITASQPTDTRPLVKLSELQSILDTTNSGIISFNSDQEIVFFNRFAEEIFGYHTDDVLGKPLAMLLPGLARIAPRSFMSRKRIAGAKSPVVSSGFLLLNAFRKNGEEFPLEISVTRLEHETGVNFTATIRDVTQRSQIEVSEREQRALAEALSGATLTLNSTLDLDEVLNHILAYVGLVVPHEGASIMLVHGDAARVVCVAGAYVRKGQPSAVLGYELPLDKVDNLREVVSSGKSVIVEDTQVDEHWVTVRGAEWVRSSLGAPISVSGEVIGFLSVDSRMPGAFGPQEAHRLEVFAAHAAIAIRNAQLYEDEHFQRLLAESLQLTTETMTKSTAADENLPLMLVRLQELIGCDWAAVLLLKDDDLALATSVGLPPSPGDTSPRFLFQAIPVLYEPLSTGKPLVVRDVQTSYGRARLPKLGVDLRGWIGVGIVAWDVVIGYLAAGSTTPTAYSKHQVDAVQSFAYQAALILQNSEVFSELEISRSDLGEAQVRLARAAQLQVAGEIATGIAHQVNNPLTTVIAESYLLAKYLPPDSEHYDSVIAIREAAYRAGTVIQQLVDFARARPFSLGPLDVNQSVTNAAALLRAQIEPHIARLTLNLAESLPVIQGSEKHLEDVWLKLLLNARDAIDAPGSGEIVVSTVYDKRNDLIMVTIRDNGHGIAPDRLDKIFKPFYTTKDKGIGLGLSICRDVIAKHRGTIRFESTQQQGATVLVSLPVSTRHH